MRHPDRGGDASRVPDGRRAPRPDFAALYGAVELATPDYRARTKQNVHDADATLWFGSVGTPEAKTTLWACEGMERPYLLVMSRLGVKPSAVAAWIRGVKVLNVAGSRESKAPGIGAKVEAFLIDVFARFGHAPRPG